MIENLKIKSFITKNPFSVDQNTLASEILEQMNKKKITNVCIHDKNDKKKIIGVLHIHKLVSVLKKNQ
jgi:arabinose-5-phosphate isomerase